MCYNVFCASERKYFRTYGTLQIKIIIKQDLYFLLCECFDLFCEMYIAGQIVITHHRCGMSGNVRQNECTQYAHVSLQLCGTCETRHDTGRGRRVQGGVRVSPSPTGRLLWTLLCLSRPTPGRVHRHWSVSGTDVQRSLQHGHWLGCVQKLGRVESWFLESCGFLKVRIPCVYMHMGAE